MKRGALKEGVCRLEAGRATTSRSAGPVGIGGVGEMCRWQQEKRRTYLDDPSQHKTASHLQMMADGSSNVASAAAEGDSIGTRPGEAAIQVYIAYPHIAIVSYGLLRGPES